MRKMSTLTHGWVDYIASVAMAALPSMLGWKGRPKVLLESCAGTAAVYSALTNYELGVAKVLPMKAHLAMDATSGCMLIGAALLLEDEEPEVRGTLASVGLFEIMASLMTQTTSPRERAQRRGQARHGGNSRQQAAASTR